MTPEDILKAAKKALPQLDWFNDPEGDACALAEGKWISVFLANEATGLLACTYSWETDGFAVIPEDLIKLGEAGFSLACMGSILGFNKSVARVEAITGFYTDAEKMFNTIWGKEESIFKRVE